MQSLVTTFSWPRTLVPTVCTIHPFSFNLPLTTWQVPLGYFFEYHTGWLKQTIQKHDTGWKETAVYSELYISLLLEVTPSGINRTANDTLSFLSQTGQMIPCNFVKSPDKCLRWSLFQSALLLASFCSVKDSVQCNSSRRSVRPSTVWPVSQRIRSPRKSDPGRIGRILDALST